MANKPKAIGTAGETAVVRYVQRDGFPGAERLALHGTLDEGDATLCPGVGAEVKAGKAAETASDAQVAVWLAEAEVERVNRRADMMLLVLKRKGKGHANAGQWWVYLPGWAFVYLADATSLGDRLYGGAFPLVAQGSVDDCRDAFGGHLPAVRITLAEACALLRAAGYGTPINESEAA